MFEIACISSDAFFAIFEGKVTQYILNFFVSYAVNIKGVKWKSENEFMQLITKNSIKKLYYFSSFN